MNIIVLDNENLVAECGADIVSHQLANNPASSLGLADGVAPAKLYRSLINRFLAGKVNFSSARIFSLREYAGMDSSFPQSLGYFLKTEFLDQVDSDERLTHLLHSNSNSDSQTVCKDYEQRITEVGGLDLQIVEIGSNGEIGFNYSGTSFASPTRSINLDEKFLKYTLRGRSSNKQALTLGLKKFREANHILLIATGTHKSSVIRRALEGPMSADCPASCLQFHANVTVLLDKAAAKDLEHKSQYEALLSNRINLLAASQDASTNPKEYVLNLKAVYPPAQLACQLTI